MSILLPQKGAGVFIREIAPRLPSFVKAQSKQIRLFPSSISSWTLSLEVAISACADKTAHRKVASVPPIAA